MSLFTRIRSAYNKLEQYFLMKVASSIYFRKKITIFQKNIFCQQLSSQEVSY